MSGPSIGTGNRAENRHRKTVTKALISARSKKNLGLTTDVLGHLHHHGLNFKQSHRVASGNLNQNRIGILEKLTAIKQWALQRLLKCLVRTILAFRNAITE